MRRLDRLRRLQPTDRGASSDAISADSNPPVPGGLTTFSPSSMLRRLVFEPLESRRMLAADSGFSGFEIPETSDPGMSPLEIGEASIEDVDGGGVEGESEDAIWFTALCDDGEGPKAEWVEGDTAVDPLVCGWFFGDETVAEDWVAEDWVAEDVVSEPDEWISEDETFPKFWHDSEFGPHFSLCTGSVVRDYWTDSTLLISASIEGDANDVPSLVASDAKRFPSGTMVLRGFTMLFPEDGMLSLAGVSDFPGDLILSGGTLDEQATEDLVEDSAFAGEEVLLDELEPVEIAFSTSDFQSNDETAEDVMTDDIRSTSLVPRSRAVDPAALAQAYSMFGGGFRESGESSQSPFGGRRGSRR